MLKVSSKTKNIVRLFRNPRTFILLIAVIALLSVAVFLVMTRPTQIDRLGVSYLQLLEKQTVDENIEPKYHDSYRVSDYLIYGETLTLYNKKYSASTDSMQGLNVVLKDVETQEEISFTFSGGVDAGISLGSLKQGFYEIYIYDNYVKKRVFFNEPVESENFSTMRRNEKVMNISLLADKALLEDFGMQMDKNYAFLSVVENIPMVKTIDVLIDPSGCVYNEQTNQVDAGYSVSQFKEADESLALAKQIKKALEGYGLKVQLTRDANENVSYYGKNGRPGIGYEGQAKLFLSLGMIMDENLTRPIILISPYTSGLLANDISFNLFDKKVYLPDVSADEHLNLGVLYDSFSKDEDEKNTKYEMYPQLRETGGKATFAGGLKSAQANQNYANSYGMESLLFFYANPSRSESIEYYLENKEAIVDTIVTSIVEYYEINEGLDETTVE